MFAHFLNSLPQGESCGARVPILIVLTAWAGPANASVRPTAANAQRCLRFMTGYLPGRPARRKAARQVDPGDSTAAVSSGGGTSDSPAAGRTMVNVVPEPGCECTSMVPPAFCTMLWLMASPRPVPCVFVVKNGT